jgi:hypothetical protein
MLSRAQSAKLVKPTGDERVRCGDVLLAIWAEARAGLEVGPFHERGQLNVTRFHSRHRPSP